MYLLFTPPLLLLFLFLLPLLLLLLLNLQSFDWLAAFHLELLQAILFFAVQPSYTYTLVLRNTETLVGQKESKKLRQQ